MKDRIQKIIDEAENANGDDEIQKSSAKLSELIQTYPDNTQLLHSRARLFFKLDELGPAINDYKAILKIDSNDNFAASQVEHLATILRFRNSDIFENPNTSHDPWFE